MIEFCVLLSFVSFFMCRKVNQQKAEAKEKKAEAEKVHNVFVAFSLYLFIPHTSSFFV